MRIITKEDTKILVRAISKEVPRSNIDDIDKHDLFYGGGKKFRWYPRNWNKVPYGMVNLEIPLNIAYRVGNNGYERRTLGSLDEYLYHKINSSSIAQLKKAVTKYENDVLVRVNRRLKVITMFTIEDRKGDYLVAVYDFETASNVPENIKYTDLRGDELGELLVEYIEDKGFGVEGLENESQSSYMELKVKVDNIKYWDNFVKGIVGFDKKINN